jgi:uncharacterized RDD family membrane protein YckC
MEDAPRPPHGPSVEPLPIAPPVLAPAATPELVRVTYASMVRRFWALVLDALFLWMLGWLLARAVPADAANGAVTALIAVYLVATTMAGGSVGKRMLGLRVLRAGDGGTLGVVRAVARELMRLPSLGVIAGALWMLDNPRRQTWHDLVGDSVVVREQPLAGSPPWARGVEPGAPPTAS